MANPKPDPKRHLNRVKLSDFKAKKELEGALEIELDDGTVVRVPPPELWSDEVQAYAQAEDNLTVAKLLIGEELYPGFVAAGGSAAMLLAMIAEQHGITLGESAASSTS